MKEYPFQHTSKQYLIWGAVAFFIGILIQSLLGFGFIGCLYSMIQAYRVQHPYVVIRGHDLIIRDSILSFNSINLALPIDVKKTRDDALIIKNPEKEIRIDLLFLHYDQAKELVKSLQNFIPTPTTPDLSQHLIDD